MGSPTTTPLVRGYMLAVLLLGVPGPPPGTPDRPSRLLHRARRNGRLTHWVLAVGAAQSVAEVGHRSSAREKQVGMHVVGACLTDAPAGEMPVPVLGTVDELLAMARDQRGGRCLGGAGGFETSAETPPGGLGELGAPGLDVVIVPSMTDVAGQRLQMRPVAGFAVLSCEPPTAGGGQIAKRLSDPGRLVSGAGAGLWLPIAALAIIIWFQDHRPLPPTAGAHRTWRRGVPDPGVSVPCFRRRRPRGLVARGRGRGHRGACFGSGGTMPRHPIGRFIRRYPSTSCPSCST